jgi:hypothetical protein
MTGRRVEEHLRNFRGVRPIVRVCGLVWPAAQLEYNRTTRCVQSFGQVPMSLDRVLLTTVVHLLEVGTRRFDRVHMCQEPR